MFLKDPEFISYHLSQNNQIAGKFNAKTKVISVKSMKQAIDAKRNYDYKQPPKEVRAYIRRLKSEGLLISDAFYQAGRIQEKVKNYEDTNEFFQSYFGVSTKENLTREQKEVLFISEWINRNSEEFARSWINFPKVQRKEGYYY